MKKTLVSALITFFVWAFFIATLVPLFLIKFMANEHQRLRNENILLHHE